MIENIKKKKNVRKRTQERGCSVKSGASKLSLKNLKIQTTESVVVIIIGERLFIHPGLKELMTHTSLIKDPMPSFVTEVVNVIFFWGNDGDMSPVNCPSALWGNSTSFGSLVGPPGCYLFGAVLGTWDVRTWHTALRNFFHDQAHQRLDKPKPASWCVVICLLDFIVHNS